MHELVIEDFEQETNDVAGKNDRYKEGHSERDVQGRNIGKATKHNTDDVFYEENDVSNCLSVETFLFLLTKRFLIIQGDMDKIINENICQTIH